MRLAGDALIVVLLAIYVLVFEDGRAEAWRAAGASIVGLVVADLALEAWGRRRASRDS